MPIGLTASEASPAAPQAGATPAWPDPSVIAQMANAFFQQPSHGTVPSAADPGIPLAPPSPAFFPAPNVVTTIAPYAPANPLVGPPDLPPSTIPSVVPTPNITAPHAPNFSSLPTGYGEPPMPGASPGPVGAAAAPFGLGEATQLVPATHLANPYESQSGGPEAAYFLAEAASAGARPDPFSAPSPSLNSIPTAAAPQAGATPESALAPAPAAPSFGAIGAPLEYGEATQFIPAAHLANPFDGQIAAPTPDAAYFLADAAQVGARPDALSAPVPSATSIPAGLAPQSGATEESAAAPAPTGSPAPIPASAFNFLELDLRPLAAPTRGAIGHPLDPEVIRRDFPILEERINGGKKLIWLDNAATTQKPFAVIDRISEFYKHENSNIHRAAHALAARATDAYEAAREKTRRFLNAPSAKDIVFVRGTTEGINFVAQSWGRANVREGDEILISWLEHHANIVPWQQLCAQNGAKLVVAPVDDSGQIILESYERLLGPKTRIVAITQVSNALGTIAPVTEMTALAHQHGACVLVDGAQAVSHMPVDVQAIGCDFYVFSGHKVFGPTGIGAVYGREAVLAQTPPWQGGGNMIADVTFEKTVFQAPPDRFEAGTGNIADAVGLGAALDYVDGLGMANIAAYEHGLLEYATAKMLAVPKLKLIGTAKEKASVLSFIIEGKDTIGIGKALDAEGIAVRSGHHCAQPILRRFGLEATVRPSLAFYNTCNDVDAMVDVLFKLQGRN
ncbi:family 2A encapsulin nanocompartment cargo protein cysteine desulfurase [Rhodoblastus sp.]|uniref:family 2A encapsulin nanocompartment cargo protein cysteine desulfurase n=1 Tax=Rhodoblastus sp. TaxID=1962975 RepID=UPI003F95E285